MLLCDAIIAYEKNFLMHSTEYYVFSLNWIFYSIVEFSFD